MRPLELTVAGFRSFGEETRFDWRDRRLVGIVGPIGSGKSSILDAVAFALYGKTPVFERDTKTLIKHGCDAARVILDFEVDDRRYRALRVLKVKGASQHALYRLHSGDGPLAPDPGLLTDPEPELLTDKEREMTRRVEEILHLDFGAFCRSVLLAQNRFAQFLTARATERDAVLKGVFGFDRLDAMHALARERRRRAEAAMERAESRLRDLDSLRRRSEELRASETEAATAAMALEAAETDLDALDREIAGATAEREDAETARRELATLTDERPDDVEASLARLASTEDAERVAAERLAAAREATRRAEAEERRASADGGSLEAAERALERWRRAEREQRERTEELERRRARRAVTRAARAKAEEALESGEEDRKRRSAEQIRAGSELRSARRELARHEGAEDEPSRPERARALLLRLDEARKAHRTATELLDRERAAHGAAERRRDEASSGAEAWEDAREEARRALDAARDRVAATESAHHHAVHADLAATLARTLEPGRPCPVCRQDVDVPPAPAEAPDLDAAREVLEAARRQRDAAEDELRRSEREGAARTQSATEATMAVEAARSRRDQAEQEVAARAGEIRAVEAELDSLLGTTGSESGAGQLALIPSSTDSYEDRVAALEAARGTARDAVRDAEARCQSTDEDVRTSSHRIDILRREAYTAREADQEAGASTARAEEALGAASEAAEVARRAVGDLELAGAAEDGSDPESILQARRRERESTEAATRAAREEERVREGELEAARSALASARDVRDTLGQRLAALAGRLGEQPETARDAAGLRALDSRLAKRMRERGRELDESLEAAERRGREAAETRRRRLESLGLEPDASFARALADARGRLQGLRTAREELEEQLERADTVRRELDDARAEVALYRQLAKDLAPSGFLRYLLDEERASLAALGSERFELLTAGRYRFSADGEFQVVDLANAEAVRRAETLSGGETFLASLALALALAEKVTGSGGRLDAFFLDEGFGSLDDEHLELALEGIERLVADSPRRLVVVVSHVASLRDRIEDLVVLDRDRLTGTTIVRRGSEASR